MSTLKQARLADQTPLCRPDCQLESVRDFGLVEHPREVMLDRVLADGERAGYVFVGVTGGRRRTRRGRAVRTECDRVR